MPPNPRRWSPRTRCLGTAWPRSAPGGTGGAPAVISMPPAELRWHGPRLPDAGALSRAAGGARDGRVEVLEGAGKRGADLPRHVVGKYLGFAGLDRVKRLCRDGVRRDRRCGDRCGHVGVDVADMDGGDERALPEQSLA